MINVKEMRKECKKLPQETQAGLFRNLMCAVLNEAVEDYVGKTPLGVKKVMPKYFFNKSTIIKDLKDQRMVALTDGMSVTVACNLQSNSKQIAENIEKLSKEYAIVKVDTYDAPKYQ